MLGADTHECPDLVHVVEQVVLKNSTLASGFWQQASKHGNGRGFTGSVVAQQGKDLAVVHLEIDPVDGTELVRVYLSKILDF